MVHATAVKDMLVNGIKLNFINGNNKLTNDVNENNALTTIIIARNQYNQSSDRVIAKELTNHSTGICNNMTVLLVD